MSTTEFPNLVTPAEAARVLRVSRATLQRRIASGELRAHRLGSAPNSPIRIDATELWRFLNSDREAARRAA